MTNSTIFIVGGITILALCLFLIILVKKIFDSNQNYIDHLEAETKNREEEIKNLRRVIKRRRLPDHVADAFMDEIAILNDLERANALANLISQLRQGHVRRIAEGNLNGTYDPEAPSARRELRPVIEDLIKELEKLK